LVFRLTKGTGDTRVVRDFPTRYGMIFVMQFSTNLVWKLEALTGIEGRFLLSGYPSKLYDEYATRFGWKREDFRIDNKAAGGKSKRTMTESVWMNY
jgi:hypothetical protein